MRRGTKAISGDTTYTTSLKPMNKCLSGLDPILNHQKEEGLPVLALRMFSVTQRSPKTSAPNKSKNFFSCCQHL